MQTRTAITSDEVNYLVYRYLVECGFTHSSFTFGNECNIVGVTKRLGETKPFSKVPVGALVLFIQKGLQYIELEANNAEDNDGEYCPLTTIDMITKSAEQLRESVQEQKERRKRSAQAVAAKDAREDRPIMLPPQNVHVLEGHNNEVFICAWSPKENLLASGSGDSTSRIWDLTDLGRPRPIVLRHVLNPEEKPKDVTTLDWSADGSLLATGSYDGLARIWSTEGKLVNTLQQHKGPIFCLRWSRKGDLLLSGSVDKTAIVWDGRSGKMIQQFQFHRAPTLDVDWRDSKDFATCSTDRRILICRLGENQPLKELLGHADEVNAVKWDPSGNLLASCSDDRTAKVWRPDDADPLVLTLTQHTKEIYNIKWSPTGEGSPHPNMRQLLASACFDNTARIWEIPTGKPLFTLNKHLQPVYSVAFSPTGQYVATGSFDKFVHIWSTHDGSLVKSYKGSGGIFEVCWNRTGDQVAACFSSKNVVVLDLRT